jgi:hypothetical protein
VMGMMYDWYIFLVVRDVCLFLASVAGRQRRGGAWRILGCLAVIISLIYD